MRLVREEESLTFTIHGNIKPDGDYEDIYFFFTKAIEEVKSASPKDPLNLKVILPNATNILDEVLGFWLKLVEIDKVSIEVNANEKLFLTLENIGLNNFFTLSLHHVEKHQF